MLMIITAQPTGYSPRSRSCSHQSWSNSENTGTRRSDTARLRSSQTRSSSEQWRRDCRTGTLKSHSRCRTVYTACHQRTRTWAHPHRSHRQSRNSSPCCGIHWTERNAPENLEHTFHPHQARTHRQRRSSRYPHKLRRTLPRRCHRRSHIDRKWRRSRSIRRNVRRSRVHILTRSTRNHLGHHTDQNSGSRECHLRRTTCR